MSRFREEDSVSEENKWFAGLATFLFLVSALICVGVVVYYRELGFTERACIAAGREMLGEHCGGIAR